MQECKLIAFLIINSEYRFKSSLTLHFIVLNVSDNHRYNFSCHRMAYEHLNHTYMILKNVKNNKKFAIHIGIHIQLHIAHSK